MHPVVDSDLTFISTHPFYKLCSRYHPSSLAQDAEAGLKPPQSSFRTRALPTVPQASMKQGQAGSWRSGGLGGDPRCTQHYHRHRSLSPAHPCGSLPKSQCLCGGLDLEDGCGGSSPGLRHSGLSLVSCGSCRAWPLMASSKFQMKIQNDAHAGYSSQHRS